MCRQFLSCDTMTVANLTLPAAVTMIPSLFSHEGKSMHRQLDRQSHASQHTASKTRSQPIPMTKTRSYQEVAVESGKLNALNPAVYLLRRIKLVHAKQSIRRHVHRYYSVSVFLRSDRTPLGMRDPDYIIEHSHTALVALETAIKSLSQAHTKDCAGCRRRAAFLLEHTKHHMFRTRQQLEQWIEFLIQSLIWFSLEDDGGVFLGGCEGCDDAILLLAQFLHRQHQPSTGIL